MPCIPLNRSMPEWRFAGLVCVAISGLFAETEMGTLY